MTVKFNVVNRLNTLFKLDPEFTKRMVDTRHAVNSEYVKSEEFVCMDDGITQEAGLIGVLNGLLDQDEYRIAASYDDTSMRLIGFVLVKK